MSRIMLREEGEKYVSMEQTHDLYSKEINRNTAIWHTILVELSIPGPWNKRRFKSAPASEKMQRSNSPLESFHSQSFSILCTHEQGLRFSWTYWASERIFYRPGQYVVKSQHLKCITENLVSAGRMVATLLEGIRVWHSGTANVSDSFRRLFWTDFRRHCRWNLVPNTHETSTCVLENSISQLWAMAPANCNDSHSQKQWTHRNRSDMRVEHAVAY